MNPRCLAGLLLCACAAAAAALPSAQEIVKKSVANTQADWHAAPRYNFMERDAGNDRPEKTYRVLMLDGSPYNELIAINGEKLNGAEAEQQTDRLRRETAKRQHETPEEKRKRVAEYDRERHQDDALLQEMIRAMDFRLEGEDTIDGHRCFVLEGNPKPGYQPVSRETKVLKGMRGRLWIDEQQFQWVKVQAEVFRPVQFGLFIAAVQPGTQFTLEQRPVGNSLWLPSHFSMRVRTRVLHMWSHNSADDETYWDYRLSRSAAASPTAGDRSLTVAAPIRGARVSERFAVWQ